VEVVEAPADFSRRIAAERAVHAVLVLVSLELRDLAPGAERPLLLTPLRNAARDHNYSLV